MNIIFSMKLQEINQLDFPGYFYMRFLIFEVLNIYALFVVFCISVMHFKC